MIATRSTWPTPGLVHQTPHGWLAWLDHSPARVAIFEHEPNFDELRSIHRVGATNDAAQGEGREVLRVEFLIEPREEWIAPRDFLQRLALSSVSFLTISFQYTDHCVWPSLRNWIEKFERYLNDTQAAIRLTYLFAQPDDSVDFRDFVEARLPITSVVFRDSGEDESLSQQVAERASHLADHGIRVRAQLSLAAVRIERWHSALETWRAISHNAGVDLVRPNPVYTYSLPSDHQVAEFLASVYSERKLDLVDSYPFSWIIAALRLGSAAVPYCGSPALAAIDNGGNLFGCDHRSVSANRSGTYCGSYWNSICRMLCIRCDGHFKTLNSDFVGQYERMFCNSMSLLMPRICEDLCATGVKANDLKSRQAQSRFRIAARDGKPVIWSENVITDHRNRFGDKANASANPQDLAWIRSRASGDQPARSGGQDAHPTQPAASS